MRVLVETGDGHCTWGTVGVSSNIIEASWQALVDSIAYGLLRLENKDEAETGPGAITGVFRGKC